MKHDKDEQSLITASLTAYRQQFISHIEHLKEQGLTSDIHLIQREIDKINALLLRYGY